MRFMVDKEMLIRWLMEESLMAKERLCPMCDGEWAWEGQKAQGGDFSQERKLV